MDFIYTVPGNACGVVGVNVFFSITEFYVVMNSNRGAKENIKM